MILQFMAELMQSQNIYYCSDVGLSLKLWWQWTFAIKATINEELDQLEATGIISKVTHSEWVALIVLVLKRAASEITTRLRLTG